MSDRGEQSGGVRAIETGQGALRRRPDPLPARIAKAAQTATANNIAANQGGIDAWLEGGDTDPLAFKYKASPERVAGLVTDVRSVVANMNGRRLAFAIDIGVAVARMSSSRN